MRWRARSYTAECPYLKSGGGTWAHTPSAAFATGNGAPGAVSTRATDSCATRIASRPERRTTAERRMRTSCAGAAPTRPGSETETAGEGIPGRQSCWIVDERGSRLYRCVRPEGWTGFTVPRFTACLPPCRISPAHVPGLIHGDPR